MDLNRIDSEKLLQFFHRNKTELSLLEKPDSFLKLLRDNDLIPEETFLKVSRKKGKDSMRKAIYDVLDWLEKERSHLIPMFWKCAFKEIMMKLYPTLQTLHKSLMEALSPPMQLTHMIETVELTKKKRKEPSETVATHPPPKKKSKTQASSGSDTKNMPGRFPLSTSGKLLISSTIKKKKKCNIEIKKVYLSQQDKKILHKDRMAKGINITPTQLMEKEALNKMKKKTPSKNVQRDQPLQKKSKQKFKSGFDKNQPGPSSAATSRQTKLGILSVASCRPVLPVTCGNKEGILHKDRMAKGEKCIKSENDWFTPHEFETFGGKGSNRSWKKSIRFERFTLEHLIKKEILTHSRFKRAYKKVEKSSEIKVSKWKVDAEKGSFLNEEDLSLSSKNESPYETVSEGEEDDVESFLRFLNENDSTDEEEKGKKQQPEASHDSGNRGFKVTCGHLAGTFHQKRFASGISGKSIRTDTSWMSPLEFVKEGSSQKSYSWKNDIQWEGKPLSVLIEKCFLKIHEVWCNCELCRPDRMNQKNDDECCICKSDSEKLAMCSQCPRSFHPTCHLPHVENVILGERKQWMCTFCEFRISKKWQCSQPLARQTALSRSLSKHMLECKYLLLFLCSADEKQMFAMNPSIYMKTSIPVITTSMFGKVAEKLQNNRYQTVKEFVSDIQLIFTNCASFNMDDAALLAAAKQLKELFDREFKNIFNIYD